jgi:hypothetical protein
MKPDLKAWKSELAIFIDQTLEVTNQQRELPKPEFNATRVNDDVNQRKQFSGIRFQRRKKLTRQPAVVPRYRALRRTQTVSDSRLKTNGRGS